MRKKKIANILFYGSGTILFVFFAMVIFVNFNRDSRLLGVNYTHNNVLEPQESKEDDTEKEGLKLDREYETITFEGRIIRNPTPPKESNVTKPLEDDHLTKKENSRDVKVLVYNNTGVEGLHEKLKINIESLGFHVDLAEEDDKVRSMTVIVQQTEDEYGLQLLALLNKGQIIEEIQDDPAYKLLLVLGEDYIP
jgi:hypothetical protein